MAVAVNGSVVADDAATRTSETPSTSREGAAYLAAERYSCDRGLIRRGAGKASAIQASAGNREEFDTAAVLIHDMKIGVAVTVDIPHGLAYGVRKTDGDWAGANLQNGVCRCW